MTVTERNQQILLLVQHHVGQTLESQQHVHPVNVETFPVESLGSVQLVVARLYGVRRHVGVQMVDVVVLNSACKYFQGVGDLKESAALESSSVEVPFAHSFAVGHVDRVLQVEQHVSQQFCHVETHVHLQNRQIQQPEYVERAHGC